MRNLKETNLIDLIDSKEFLEGNIVANANLCLSEDLTLEEVNSILNEISNLRNEFVKISEQLDSIISSKKEQLKEFQSIITPHQPTELWILSGVICWVALVLSLVAWSIKSIQGLTYSLSIAGICIAIIIVTWTNYQRKLNKYNSQKEFLKKELDSICKQENNVCTGLHVHTAQEASILYQRLVLLDKNLFKMRCILMDDTLSDSNRMLQIETLFSFLKQEMARQEQTNYARQQTDYAKQSAESMKQQEESLLELNRKIERQTQLIKEKARIDESHRQNGQPWRF